MSAEQTNTLVFEEKVILNELNTIFGKGNVEPKQSKQGVILMILNTPICKGGMFMDIKLNFWKFADKIYLRISEYYDQGADTGYKIITKSSDIISLYNKFIDCISESLDENIEDSLSAIAELNSKIEQEKRCIERANKSKEKIAKHKIIQNDIQ